MKFKQFSLLFAFCLPFLFISCLKDADHENEPGCWTLPPASDLPQTDGINTWIGFAKNDTFWLSGKHINGLGENLLSSSPIEINYHNYEDVDILSLVAEMSREDTCQTIYSTINFSIINPSEGQISVTESNADFLDYVANVRYNLIKNDAFQMHLSNFNQDENKIEGIFEFDMLNVDDEQDTLHVRLGRFQGDF